MNTPQERGRERFDWRGCPLKEGDGHQLAADMIRELRAHWQAREEGVPDDQIDALWQREDSRILRQYFEITGQPGNEAIARGFFAVLTDMLGNVDGTDPEFYETTSRDRAAPAP